MHAQLFSLVTAAAALLLPSVAIAGTAEGHAVRDAASPRHHRSRAKWIQKRNNTMPTGWSLEAACLTDAAEPDRLLPYNTLFMNTLTPSLCVAHCDSEGFSYSAVQDGHECWCGAALNNSTKAGLKADVSACTMPCSGNTDLNCGGYFALTLYSKSANSTGTHSYSHSYTQTRSVTTKLASSSVQPTTSVRPTTTSSIVKGASTTSSHAVPTSSVSSTKSSSYVASSSTKPASSTSPSTTGKYKLVEDMSGDGFFDHFGFFTGEDPTGGQVDYVDATTAMSSGLAYVANNQAVMKVDSTTWLASGAQRKSVRVTSNKAYANGVMVFDVASMPYGCSVWPAMWTVGADWPSNGEIDLIEGVNNGTSNQLTVHTGSSTSCSTSAVPKTAISTSPLGTSCASTATSNAGCAYSDNSYGAYGAEFNQAGGAVFALVIDPDSGVFVYKWTHGKVPSDVTAGAPNPASDAWGTPQAAWPTTNNCKTGDVIGPQQVVFDITLCGNWCNSAYPSSGCPGTCTQQVMDPTNYKNAAWVVNSVKVYQ